MLAPAAPTALSAPLRLASDTQLARRVAGGSEQAFTALYRRYQERLYAYCRSIVREEEDARDALQGTMLKALAGLRGNGKVTNVRAWLFRIAHNESVSILRARRPHTDLDEASAGTDDGMDDALMTHERIEQLLRDLQSLSERQRGALVMHELADLDYPEIGAALEMSPLAVRQAVFEARTALSDFATGREQDCDTVRRAIAERGRPGRRPRTLRAHLRSCGECRAFDAMERRRRRDLALLPSALAASGALDGLGGAAARGGGGLAGLLAAVLGGAGGGAPAALKCGAAVLAVCAGGGAIKAVDPLERVGPSPGATARGAPTSVQGTSDTRARTVPAADRALRSEGGGASRPAQPVRAASSDAARDADRSDRAEPEGQAFAELPQTEEALEPRGARPGPGHGRGSPGPFAEQGGERRLRDHAAPASGFGGGHDRPAGADADGGSSHARDAQGAPEHLASGPASPVGFSPPRGTASPQGPAAPRPTRG